MDVPSWHPANQNSDAVRRQAMSGGTSAPKRTEFNMVDTLTEAERQMVAKEEENVVLGGGPWLQDPSDRLYLVEQTRLERQAHSREKMERQAALQTFRSNALKMQAHNPSMPGIPVVSTGSGKKSLLPAEKKTVVVIMAKKRQTRTDGRDTKAKKTKKSQAILGISARNNEEDGRTRATKVNIQEQDKRKKSDATSTKSPAKSPATTLLLQDYSNSSDDE